MRAALRHPPQTQPVSSEIKSGRSSQPSVDQCPKATTSPAVCRPGTSNQGMKPGGAPSTPLLSLVSNSMRPSAEHRRSRVSALTITRSRAAPCRPSCHSSGWLPYIWCMNTCQSAPRSTVSTSAASCIVRAALHCGSTPACTISTPRSCSAMGRWRSQSSSASRSGAARMSPSVSVRCGRRTPCDTTSRCRSWLPSRQAAASPSAAMRRSTASDSGPRLTRSPSSTRRSRLGEKAISSSSRPSAVSQPCTSPIR